MTIEQINHTGTICDEVYKKRVLHDENWGPQKQTTAQYVLMLHKEIGQVAIAFCDADFSESKKNRFARMENLRNELIQVAALAVAMVESLDKNELRSYLPFKLDSEGPASDVWVFDQPTPP